jgi:hypothetical protein
MDIFVHNIYKNNMLIMDKNFLRVPIVLNQIFFDLLILKVFKYIFELFYHERNYFGIIFSYNLTKLIFQNPWKPQLVL